MIPLSLISKLYYYFLKINQSTLSSSSVSFSSSLTFDVYLNFAVFLSVVIRSAIVRHHNYRHQIRRHRYLWISRWENHPRETTVYQQENTTTDGTGVEKTRRCDAELMIVVEKTVAEEEEECSEEFSSMNHLTRKWRRFKHSKKKMSEMKACCSVGRR